MVKRNERRGNLPLGYGADADGSISSPRKKKVAKKANTPVDTTVDKPKPTPKAKKAPKKKTSPKTKK
jgi:hypothetical protein